VSGVRRTSTNGGGRGFFEGEGGVKFDIEEFWYFTRNEKRH